jgi:hypothetical protein
LKIEVALKIEVRKAAQVKNSHVLAALGRQTRTRQPGRENHEHAGETISEGRTAAGIS